MPQTTIEYVGRYEGGIDVKLPDGRWEHVPHGGTLTTTAEHAESLLTQAGEWRKAKTAAKKDDAPAGAESP